MRSEGKTPRWRLGRDQGEQRWSRRERFSLFVRLQLSGLRERTRRLHARRGRGATADAAKPRWRRWTKRVLIACAAWIALTFVAFEVSAQIQSGRFDAGADSILGGGPFMFASPQTILLVGTDARPPNTKEPGAALTPKCYSEQAVGAPPARDCPGDATDTMMLIRAGGGVFRKLMIPRDSYAEIPGHPPQKIDAAYALGGAKVAVRAVERYLGVHIDHVVVLDFKSFEDFINAIGGITVDVPERICSKISGGFANGGYTLNLSKGEHSMDGAEALAYARTRKNSCDRFYTDLRREQAQQGVMAAIKDRLTDPLRLPYNFIRGPLIAWDAPRAFVSDMGAWTMPQLLLSAALGGGSQADGLCQRANCDLSYGPHLDDILVPAKERRRAVNKFLHG